MPPQTLFFTGAPALSTLEWDSANLLETFSVPIARFAKLSPSSNETAGLSSDIDGKYAAWRSLEIERQHLPTGHSQVHTWVKEYQGSTDFFTTSELSLASFDSDLDTFQPLDASVSGTESFEELLSQFYEHSHAVHTTAIPSQVDISRLRDGLTQSQSDTGASFATSGTSFPAGTESFSDMSPSILLPIRPAIPVGSSILNLSDIPNARFLDSIQPQTMTVNILVGIISITKPRAIKTRRGAEVEIVELLVGDETRSGFGVSFWLSGHSKYNHAEQNTGEVRKELLALRPQDIVLLRNVALSAFRGKVYGQSLKKEKTKLDLLYRNRIDKTDIGGYYNIGDFDRANEAHPQLIKTMSVKEWVFQFVAPGVTSGLGEGVTSAVTESLPLDTQ